MKRPALPWLVVLVVVAATLLGAHQAGARLASQLPRIVAIGDVHGAAEAFEAILRRAGLIDGRQQWIGGRSILVQTGDMTDRGAGMKEALDLLMALEPQARRAGGRVHALLGNHEVMNLTGEMRDVTPEIFASFGGEAAMREAFGPTGRYGRWLRARSAIVNVGGTIFMHAGVDPEYTTESLKEINRRIALEIQQWDEGVRWLVRQKLVPPSPPLMQAAEVARAEILRMNADAEQGVIPEDAPQIANLLLPVANIGASSLYAPEGPMWFRGYSTWPQAVGTARLDALLRRNGAHRMVTGHTVQPGGRIRSRFDGALYLIDTGMLGRPYFPGGRPSALVLEGNSATQLYLD